MPLQQSPPPVVSVDPEVLPFKFAEDPIGDALALTICQQSFLQFESWRLMRHDSRWKRSEELYFGRVKQRFWEGTKTPRSSIAVQKAAQVVDAAFATISQELFYHDDLIRAVPLGRTTSQQAMQIRDRLRDLLEHNIDDYGWRAVLELENALLDVLIYGNCYGIVEYDFERRQPIVLRLDPRDVFVDPACRTPYIDSSRRTIVRRVFTVEQIEGWRGVPGFKVPPANVLWWFAKNRQTLQSDLASAGAKGESYTTADDALLTDPTAQNINVFVHFSPGREVWTLDNQWVLRNDRQPYKCSRLVSAPCYRIPNRHYAESMVDRSDGIQSVSTTLVNRHVDEVTLALDPPRSMKASQTMTPSQKAWGPGQTFTATDPKNDVVIHQPQGITGNVFQTLAALDTEHMKNVGLSSLALSGTPAPSNMNRTAGGVGAGVASTNARLAPLAANFENFFLRPLLYKMLKVDEEHKREGNGRYE